MNFPIIQIFFRSKHLREVTGKASAAFVVKIFASGATFLYNVVLARLLGAEGAGIFFLALTIQTVASVIARLGIDSAFVKFVASNSSSDNWKAVKGVYILGMRIALIGSIIVATLLYMLADPLAIYVFKEQPLAAPLRLMAFGLPAVTTVNLYASLFKGLRRTVASVIILSLGVPLFAIPCSIIIASFLGVNGVVIAHISANFAVSTIALILWNKALPSLIPKGWHFEVKHLMNTALPMFWSSFFQIFSKWSTLFILGALGSSTDVGIFSISSRTAALINFILVAVNSISAPKFAELYRKKNIVEIENVAKSTSLLLTLFSFPILIFFLFAPNFILGWFGDNFTKGSISIMILAVAQFINVSTGSADTLLMMCGHEKLQRNNIAFNAIANIILSFLLIPFMGINGAAIAAGLTLASQNITAAILVRKQMGLWTFPLLGKMKK